MQSEREVRVDARRRRHKVVRDVPKSQRSPRVDYFGITPVSPQLLNARSIGGIHVPSDWGKLLGDTAAVTALLDRLLHHAHVLKCGPRSWRTKVHTDLRTEEATK